MTQDSSTLRTVRDVLTRILGLDPEQSKSISADSTSADLPRWDSRNQLSIVMDLEDELGITFADDEIATLTSVAALVASIEKKRG